MRKCIGKRTEVSDVWYSDVAERIGALSGEVSNPMFQDILAVWVAGTSIKDLTKSRRILADIRYREPALFQSGTTLAPLPVKYVPDSSKSSSTIDTFAFHPDSDWNKIRIAVSVVDYIEGRLGPPIRNKAMWRTTDLYFEFISSLTDISASEVREYIHWLAYLTRTLEGSLNSTFRVYWNDIGPVTDFFDHKTLSDVYTVSDGANWKDNYEPLLKKCITKLESCDQKNDFWIFMVNLLLERPFVGLTWSEKLDVDFNRITSQNLENYQQLSFFHFLKYKFTSSDVEDRDKPLICSIIFAYHYGGSLHCEVSRELNDLDPDKKQNNDTSFTICEGCGEKKGFSYLKMLSTKINGEKYAKTSAVMKAIYFVENPDTEFNESIGSGVVENMVKTLVNYAQKSNTYDDTEQGYNYNVDSDEFDVLCKSYDLFRSMQANAISDKTTTKSEELRKAILKVEDSKKNFDEIQYARVLLMLYRLLEGTLHTTVTDDRLTITCNSDYEHKKIVFENWSIVRNNRISIHTDISDPWLRWTLDAIIVMSIKNENFDESYNKLLCHVAEKFADMVLVDACVVLHNVKIDNFKPFQLRLYNLGRHKFKDNNYKDAYECMALAVNGHYNWRHIVHIIESYCVSVNKLDNHIPYTLNGMNGKKVYLRAPLLVRLWKDGKRGDLLDD